MTKILLIRHGNVEGIKPERFRGPPAARSDRARPHQARAVAQRVRRCLAAERIYTSPMGRCIETGAAIAKACGAPTEVCGDLTDIDYGGLAVQNFR